MLDLFYFKFCSLPPIIVSSNVETFWVVSNNHYNPLINKLMNFSLWLNCGSNGMKVWLPLSDEDNEIQQQNRIVLSFPLKFYPLGTLIAFFIQFFLNFCLFVTNKFIGLLVNESLFIGACSELVCINQNYSQIQKTVN